MAKVLNATVHVRHGFTAVALLAGSEVPEWAEGQVGDHLLTEVAAIEVESAPSGDEPSESDESTEVAAVEVESAPSMDWTAAQIKQYAEEHGVDLGGATTKADMLAAIDN